MSKISDQKHSEPSSLWVG